MRTKIASIIGILFVNAFVFAQQTALVATEDSPYAKLHSVDMQDVVWTNGFWKEQFDVERESTLPFMWDLYKDPEVTHAYRNFEIAAGLMKGEHDGPSFHDGDFYKLMEAMAAAYAVTGDEELDKELDEAIVMIDRAQREDGYIHTPVVIEEKWGTLGPEELQKQLGFEKYNMGHLMTAACVHYRATGKESFLEIAKGVTDYLYDFYKKASPELARNAICPSHYMGVVEMYRTLKNPKYLELANNLIDIRGTTNDGTDDNQDRIPFREQTTAMGHAVRANYLYAGVADLYSETGEEKLLEILKSIWDDVTYRKMYVTGAHGSLYDGVSPDGTSYNPNDVQKIHQAYGRPYQLPNATAHNETCANIGNALWNWRMLKITGEAKYADVMELTLYNSVLSGIGLEGQSFFYNNPLNVSEDLPFEQRWGNTRKGYISLSNCCPPNVTRTLAEIHNYAYSLSDNGLYVNLYGSNRLDTQLDSGEEVSLEQETNYPWDGEINLDVNKIPDDEFSIFLRIPSWANEASLNINGEPIAQELVPGNYLELKREWKTGDKISLNFPMHPQLIEANPLVEEAKNQVAVKRGPLVYCIESADLPENVSVNDVSLDLEAGFDPEMISIKNRQILSLNTAAFVKENRNWEKQLYRPLGDAQGPISVKLIPYYAWSNRGDGEMSVWLPY